jgi:hypothetical protein
MGGEVFVGGCPYVFFISIHLPNCVGVFTLNYKVLICWCNCKKQVLNTVLDKGSIRI